MNTESPVVVLPFSPIVNVIPGELRSASDRVAAARSCSSSLLSTVIVWGVSSSGCVNFGDEARSTL